MGKLLTGRKRSLTSNTTGKEANRSKVCFVPILHQMAAFGAFDGWHNNPERQNSWIDRISSRILRVNYKQDGRHETEHHPRDGEKAPQKGPGHRSRTRSKRERIALWGIGAPRGTRRRIPASPDQGRRATGVAAPSEFHKEAKPRVTA